MSEPVYKGTANKLEDIDIPRIGSEIGVKEDPIHAILEVETSGSGFDSQGRLKMLFEPHKFYHHLKGNQLQDAVAKGLAYPHQGMKPYPRDSYPHLDAAMEINSSAALMSASWGLPQIMGENFGMLGFSSVEEMVSAFAESEANQLQGMIDFIKAAGIDDDLRRIEKIIDQGRTPTPQDWVPLVRAYNGPKYKVNNYDVRANSALKKWMKIKDTPYGQQSSIKDMAAAESAGFAAGNVDEVHASQVQQAEISTETSQQQLPTKVDTPPDTGVSTTSPVTKEIIIPPAQASDSGSKKSLWAMILGLPMLALTWLTQNIGEALGWLKDRDLMRWVVLGVVVLVGLYLLRQLVMSVVRQVSATIFTLHSMKYHADPASNNVTVGQPAPPPPDEEK